MELDLVRLGHGTANRGAHFRRPIARAAALDLGCNRQPLDSPDVDGEGSHASRPDRRMGVLGGPLDVLRVEISPADDDEVLQAAGDEELAAADEPEVARAKERPGAVEGRPEDR